MVLAAAAFADDCDYAVGCGLFFIEKEEIRVVRVSQVSRVSQVFNFYDV